VVVVVAGFELTHFILLFFLTQIFLPFTFAALSTKFTMEVQEKTPIYEEPEACDESIIMTKPPAPELTENNVPKVISLNRLILKITDPFNDDYWLRVFWFTYRTFAKPKVVLKKFIERFDVPPLNDSLNYSYLEEHYYNVVLKRAIQEKVISLLYDWVQNYFFDFEDDMVEMLSAFCSGPLSQAEYKGAAQEILDALKTVSRQQQWQQAKPLDQAQAVISLIQSRTSGRPPPNTPEVPFKLINATDKEIAEQLTLIDFRFYSEVKFSEMLGQAWNKDKKRHMAPNLMLNINFLNKVSSWVSYQILTQEDDNKRKKVIKKFLRVMGELRELNSYNMIMAVNSGLNTSSIHRLSNLWELIGEKELAVKEPINELIATSGNSKNFRDAMNTNYNTGKNCSPYVGIYLRDLVFLDDGNPTFMDGKINFMKCIQTYNIYHQVLRFQGREYRFTPNTAFIKEILNYKVVDDETMYKISLQVQPRKG